jgi:ribosomal protein L40E
VPAVVCSKCATDLPQGAEFCLKCGQPVKSNGANAALPPVAAILGCTKCGTSLPEGAQFCPKCGKSVVIPRTTTQPNTSSDASNFATPDSAPIEPLPTKTHHVARRIILALIAVLLLLVVAWLGTSDNPYAQGVQELVGWKHDQGIVDNPFTLSPHNFRYYKFALPQGATRVSIVGQFNAASEAHSSRKTSDPDADNTIEVYVLSEPAFTIWQNGYAASTVYESGRVSQGTMQADLPPGAGIYYLVFSNKFAPKSAKSVNADVLLHYKNWMPESFRRVGERVWNWLGV